MIVSGNNCVSFEALPQAASPAWLPNPPPLPPLLYFLPLSPHSHSAPPPIPATIPKIFMVLMVLHICKPAHSSWPPLLMLTSSFSAAPPALSASSESSLMANRTLLC